MKELYDITKKLAGKYSRPERPVKDKEGKPIRGDQEQRNRWVEHFEELLNNQHHKTHQTLNRLTQICQ